MGQIQSPAPPPSIILTSVDRLVASNADGGLSPLAAHIILFGEDAGQNLGDVDSIIALGAFALDAGVADTDIAGTIAIGVNAGSAVTGGTNNDDGTAESVIIGRDAARTAQFLSGMVVIGGQALRNYTGSAVAAGAERSVIIGSEACQNQTGAGQFTSNVVIGFRCFRGNAGSSTGNVLIGDQIAINVAAPAALNGNVVIGSQAGAAMGASANTCTQNVIIGQGAAAALDTGDDNVVIGQSASLSAVAAADQSSDVVIGKSALAYGGKHTVIGANARTSVAGVVGARSVIIGFGAGATLPNGTTDILAVETFDNPTNRTLLYGDFAKGCIILGNSAQGVDRDMGDAAARNLVKILNGVLGATNPTGGGFLFGAAGELNWRSSAGVTYLLTPNAIRGTFTVAALPAGAAGQRAYVTDALAPVFAAAPAGGGAIFTPVYHDGAIWRCG